MNVWLVAATSLLWCLVPCGIACFRGDAINRLVALEAGGTVVTLALLLMAEGFHRIPFFDVALTSALLCFGGGLVFAQFIGRRL